MTKKELKTDEPKHIIELVIKDKLKKEAEEWLNKWELCNKCENKVDCVSNFSYCQKVVLQSYLASAEPREKRIADLEKENAELRKVAEFQQSSNMNTHLENKKLKEGLAVGSTWNKHLNSQNKALEEERDEYRNMVFDKIEQLTKAEEIIRTLYFIIQGRIDYEDNIQIKDSMDLAKAFLNEVK